MARVVLPRDFASARGIVRGRYTGIQEEYVFTEKQVLSEQVGRDELTEAQAVRIIENALYNTAARVYEARNEEARDGTTSVVTRQSS